MRDHSGMYIQFANFVELVEGQGRIPTESDIEFFAERFLIEEYGFQYPEGGGGAYIYSANYVNKDTGSKVMDTSNATFKELYEEIMPLLKTKASKVYDSLGSIEEAYYWNPEPISEPELAKRFALDGGMTEAGWNKLSGAERRNHPAFIKAVKELSKKEIKNQRIQQRSFAFYSKKNNVSPTRRRFLLNN